jgi:hypothetical protein
MNLKDCPFTVKEVGKVPWLINLGGPFCNTIGKDPWLPSPSSPMPCMKTSRG